MNRLKAALLPAGLILLALVGALAVMATGPLAVAPEALLAAVIGTGSPEAELALALRGPRLLAALTCGAALAGAGAGFQILFRNPLAAPDLLGVSSGAGLGAARPSCWARARRWCRGRPLPVDWPPVDWPWPAPP